MAVHFHEEDLPPDVKFADGPIAVDTEAMGLVPGRDRLCLVQLSDGTGDEHLVRFGRGSDYAAPNLKALLGDPQPPEALSFRAVRRRHHAGLSRDHGRVRFIARAPPRGWCAPIPIATASRTWSRNCSTSTCRSSSRPATGAPTSCRDAQREYAASDVRYLHALKDKLDERLEREGPHAACPGLLRFPAGARAARYRRLARAGHLRA